MGGGSQSAVEGDDAECLAFSSGDEDDYRDNVRRLTARGTARSSCECPFNVCFWNADVLSAGKLAEVSKRCNNFWMFDLVLMVEVGREELPEVFPGFQCVAGQPRVNRSERGAGKGQGMVALVRHKWAQRCSVVKKADYVMWLRFDLPGRVSFFVACVYIPPVDSVEWKQLGAGSWQEVFSDMQADVAAFQALGEVCLFGDFNAHTATADDTGSAAEQVLDSMGVLAGQVAPVAVPARKNSDARSVCHFGQQLLALCAATNSVILNGRTDGDLSGAATFVSRRPAAGGGNSSNHSSSSNKKSKQHAVASTSVLDYGIVSRSLLSRVANFAVVPSSGLSDHNMLVCALSVPEPPVEELQPFASMPPVRCIRWDPSKRSRYVAALKTHDCVLAREAALQQVRGCHVSPSQVSAACEAWCDAIRNVAEPIFGVSGGGQCVRAGDGRAAKRWFPHCKQEWAALRVAVRNHNSHAAAAARKVFNAAKRRAKRHCEKQWQARLLDDLRYNPRRFWTAYKGRKMSCMLQDMGAVDRHWRALYGSPGQHSLPEEGASVASFMSKLLSECQDGPAVAAAAHLNEPFAADEVESVLLRMHNGRMPGPDGLRGELFKGAYEAYVTSEGYKKHVYLLHEDLSELFSAVYKCGQVPGVWCSAYLSAVFKKGDPSVLDNYRGIAVGSVMGKMFSMLIEKRLSAYCEQHGFRAWGQAGFRERHRTCDHVFVLKHLVDRSRLRGHQLFACFVDFKKAYDLVRRDLLMRCLADIGLRGNILTAIVSMYWNAPMVTKMAGNVGQPFDSTRGVKQGDPLSPLLFGIFIDRVEQWLSDRCGACGTALGNRMVRLLLYADDLVLLAETSHKLQQLLDALQSFCSEYDMQVNVGKTEIVVFGKRKYTGAAVWQYQGQQVPVSDQFKYLGVQFHATRGVSACTEALAAAGSRAMWAMLARCKEHGVSNLSMQVQLFNTLVSPILCYCSEVWGPALLRQPGSGAALVGKLQDNVISRVQYLFLRTIAGRVRKSTCRMLLSREFGAQPLVCTWLRAALAMWNRAVELGDASLLGRAMRENLRLSQTSSSNRERERERLRIAAALPLRCILGVQGCRCSRNLRNEGRPAVSGATPPTPPPCGRPTTGEVSTG